MLVSFSTSSQRESSSNTAVNWFDLSPSERTIIDLTPQKGSDGAGWPPDVQSHVWALLFLLDVELHALRQWQFG